MKLIYTFCILFLSFGLSTYAQKQTTPEDMAELFFKNFEEKGYSFALEQFYSSNKWLEENTGPLDELTKGLNSLTNDFVGSYYGYELITKKQISDSFVLLSFMVRYERQPIRFIFKFYKPNDSWISYGLKYDDSFSAEIEEAAKLYHLNLESKYRY